MSSKNQQPEQIARDTIDQQLRAAGWSVQSKTEFDFSAGEGQAIKEYQTDEGPADYVLFVDNKPVGVIEAKKETLGHAITTVEDQTEGYAAAILKSIQQNQTEIESQFGNPLTWESAEDRRASCIRYTLTKGGYRSPEEKWPEIQQEAVSQMEKFHAALRREITDI